MTTVSTITLATIGEPQPVKATVIDGLAYHHRNIGHDAFSHDEWVVTHVASGRNPLPECFSFRTEKACQIFIEEIRPLADWSLSAEELWMQHGKLYSQESAPIKEALKKAYQKALAGQYEDTQKPTQP